jgi:glycosyltransferase involved in cell wall biosynthesis
MKKVLFLAYHFPPIGGAGVQRNAKFVRYLREFGYEPIVVTGPGPRGDDRWTPSDPTLEGDIPDGTVVHRIPADGLRMGGCWRGRAERWIGLETAWSRWWRRGVLEIAPSVASDADLIFAGLAPYDAATPAARLSRLVGKPWVADLQDPWALDEMAVYPTALHRRAALRTMGRTLGAADAVVMNTPESRNRVLRSFPELGQRPVVTITNGFDATDFRVARPEPEARVFRIVHTGYLHTELGQDHRRLRHLRRLLGGAMSGVDILPRSHVFLLEAVERLRRDEPEVGNQIEIHLAGVLSAIDHSVAARSQAVKLHGYIPHAQAVELMQAADLLFLPMQELVQGARVGITPGKTYEYLASGTPILAAVPEGDVRDLLNEAGNASVCAPSDVDAMVAILRAAVVRKRSGVPPRSPRADVLVRYERRMLTRQLAGVFDQILGAASVSETTVAA